MKTPQEQAKELVFDLKLNSWSKSHILESIPLAELIAVAQAACSFDYEEPQFKHEWKMKETLDALRATNKIEL